MKNKLKTIYNIQLLAVATVVIMKVSQTYTVIFQEVLGVSPNPFLN